jgi:hypothetical protein
MQAIDALRTTIDLAKANLEGKFLVVENPGDDYKQAIELTEQISQGALPIARFECMVTVEKVGDRSKLGLGDFTICCLDVAGLKNGLIGLSMEKLTVYVRLWERFQHGHEMLSGYQGETKCLAFRNFLADLDRFQPERQPTRTAVDVAS